MSKNTVPASNVVLASDVFRCGFTSAGSHPFISEDFDILQTAAGQTILQTGGNLVLTSGTTANEATFARTKRSFVGAHTCRFKSILSQRIANNQFVIEMADTIGDNLAFSNPSSTSVIVTIPLGIFTGVNIGQSLSIGAITTVAGVPGDAVIASYSEDRNAGTALLGLTVSGWPGVGGTGTCTLFGWNCYRALYDSTTATNIKWECRRRGYNATFTAFTMSTTASPGHVAEWKTDNVTATFSDTSATMSTTSTMTIRGIRMENLPDDDVVYKLYIYQYNGTTNPATTTTWTLGFVGVEAVGNNKVQAIAPVTPATSSLGTVSVSSMPTTSGVAGAAAAGSSASGNPVQIGLVAATAIQTARSAGQIVIPAVDKIGRFVGAAQQIRDLTTMQAMVTLTTTTETTLVAAVASIFNDMKMLVITNTSATATRVDFRTTTAGTVVLSVMSEAGKTLVLNMQDILGKQATVNTNWTVQLGTAVTDVRVTAFTVQAN